jgi:hypothetical protein
MSTLDKLYTTLNTDFLGVMSPDDWRQKGPSQYNPNNKWNNSTTTGTIAHLVQDSNSLYAEVDIAAQGTVIRKGPDDKIITDKARLINCSRYGDANRNSDPTVGHLLRCTQGKDLRLRALCQHFLYQVVRLTCLPTLQIGDGINNLARKGIKVSIANPIGIYMQSFNTATLKLDIQSNGVNMIAVPKGTFQWQRGDIQSSLGLRLKIKIPDGVVGTGPRNKGKQLLVSDIFDTKNGKYIEYGAQFSDYITMSVNGVGITGGKPAAPLSCPKKTSTTGFSRQVMTDGVSSAEDHLTAKL